MIKSINEARVILNSINVDDAKIGIVVYTDEPRKLSTVLEENADVVIKHSIHEVKLSKCKWLPQSLIITE